MSQFQNKMEQFIQETAQKAKLPGLSVVVIRDGESFFLRMGRQI